MRPLWYEFPANEATFKEDAAFMLGPAMLVAPVLAAGVDHVDAPLPRWVGRAASGRSGLCLGCGRFGFGGCSRFVRCWRRAPKQPTLPTGHHPTTPSNPTPPHPLPKHPPIQHPPHPSESQWYESVSGQPMRSLPPAPGADQSVRMGVHMEGVPVFYRGGHIVPRRWGLWPAGFWGGRRGPWGL